MTVTLSQLLAVRTGVTAVVGGGGKTTLLRVLGQELARAGSTVILCTTTKICPFSTLETVTSDSESQLAETLRAQRLLCAGTPLAGGKLTAPAIPVAHLAQLAEYVLVEADGSAHLPLKAHEAFEPVIPPEANQTICVVGLSGLGRPIRQAAHRPERYALLAGAAVDDPVTPETAARVLNGENLADRYFLNQADTPEIWEWARRLAALLERPAAAGSLLKEEYFSC